MSSELFRKEVYLARGTTLLGTILLTQGRGVWWFTASCILLAVALVSFGFLGEYTRKARVQGQVLPSGGVVKVISPLSGVVMSRSAGEGGAVEAGQMLFEVSGERIAADGRPTQEVISHQLRERRASLERDLAAQEQLYAGQSNALRLHVSNLRMQLQQVRMELETQERREKLAETTAHRFRALVSAQFAPALQGQQKDEELLDQQTRTMQLRRTQLSLNRELASVSSELEQLPTKLESQLASIKRNIGALEQELSDNESRRKVVVAASQTGVVTGILADVGQSVQAGQPVMSIIPRASTLEVHLFAQSKAVGFIRPGQKVLVRFQSFPYQKFGHHEGTVRHVSRTALSSTEIPPALSGASTVAENFFRITVALPTQDVIAYGSPQKLHSGMQVEADVLLDTRKLYEWVLEPLYSVTGRI